MWWALVGFGVGVAVEVFGVGVTLEVDSMGRCRVDVGGVLPTLYAKMDTSSHIVNARDLM
jgi:hypothetical protein